MRIEVENNSYPKQFDRVKRKGEKEVPPRSPLRKL